MQPLLDSPPAGPPVREGVVGTAGRRRADRRPRALARAVGAVMSTELGDGAKPLDAAGAAERRRAVAVHADRRLRVPVGLPHGRAGGARRRDRLAVRPALRLPERVRHAARPRGGRLPARAVRDQRPARAHLRAGHERADARRGTRRRAGWSSATRSSSARGTARTRSRRTPGRRPTTTPSTCWCAPPSASRAPSRSSWSASRSSTTGARPPSGRWSATTCTRPTPRAPARRSGCGPTWRSGSRRGRVRARHTLQEGERMYCSLSWAEGLASPADAGDAAAQLDATAHFWRSWVGRARIPDQRWRQPILRSALAIKGLTYMPTGATVAALTTSLPETPGGERNWDYRYTWMRDTTFTLQALHWLNLDWEADEFMQFVADVEANEDGALQIMYGIDGRRDLTESTRDDLSGYAGARPGAGRQRRLRPASERRVRRGARLGAAAHAPQRAAAAAAVADRREPGRVRDARVARARPGDLGGARRAAALRLLEADVLGRARPRGQAGRDPRRPRSARRRGRRRRRRSAPTSSSTASTSAACCASTTRPTRSTPRRCWRRCSGSCRPTTSGCGRACSRSRTS